MWLVMDRKVALLFDLDGVVLDTEGLYTEFWDNMGMSYLGQPDFCRKIKGQTLDRIFNMHFNGMDQLQKEITERIDSFEREMPYDYIPGAERFIRELRGRGVPMAVVTSSNRKKMENVYDRHPDFRGLFDRILTGEDFTRSKPAPDCFLLGMDVLGSQPGSTIVFEDSFAGLQAARDSGAAVAGLATTNSREDIAPLCDIVLDDFRNADYGKLCSMLL